MEGSIGLGKVNKIYLIPEILKYSFVYEQALHFLYTYNSKSRSYLRRTNKYLSRVLWNRYDIIRGLVEGTKEMHLQVDSCLDEKYIRMSAALSLNKDYYLYANQKEC